MPTGRKAEPPDPLKRQLMDAICRLDTAERRHLLAAALALAPPRPAPPRDWKELDRRVLFRGEFLRCLFKEHGIVKGMYKLPTLDGFAELTATLAGFVFVRDCRRQFRPYHDNWQGLISALRITSKALPPVLESARMTLRCFGERGQGQAFDMQRRRVEELERLAAATEGVRVKDDSLLHPPGLEEWHGLAPVLAWHFRVAMHTGNPGVTLGLSNAGPVVRFLVAVIPLLTGEQASADAVARFLQRAEKARG